MNEIRCGNCRRKLGEGIYMALSTLGTSAVQAVA